jgi:septal ring factor EnvC (AmiA/AmiB activator)
MSDMPCFCIVAQSFLPTSQLWLLIGAIAIALVIVFILRARARPRDAAPQLNDREIQIANRRTEQIHQELEALLNELEKASARITSRIEQEFSRLSSATAEADRRISALRILLEASRKLSDHEPVQQPRAAQAPAATIIDTRHERICALSDEGFTCAQIAQRLSESPGEVELILNLRASHY